MKTMMESLQDLIEEAKLRTVWWILCTFVVTYFLTHTSKSMLMNAPVAIFLVAGLRVLLNEVEIRWKVQNNKPTSYLSHLEKKQLSVNDSRLSTLRPPQRWKRKIDSPIVESAMEDFINKLMQDFVVDLWYSDITPDKEAPDLIHDLIMDVLGEVAGRIKEVNLVDLLTRDIVDLIGDHIDLFRRNQAAIGVDVMETLSSEERDERLKHHLLASKELHPALISSECEYKVLQRLMSGLLAVVMRPRDVQCPLVRCIARELLTCLVMQPIMNFASPRYVNELLENIILCNNEEGKGVTTDQSSHGAHSPEWAVSGEHGQSTEFNMNKSMLSSNQGTDMSLVLSQQNVLEQGGPGDLMSSTTQDDSMQTRHAEWAKAFEAATQRRTEVLTPENLENMWTIGRNYKKKLRKTADSGIQASEVTGSVSGKALMQPPIPKPQQKIQYLCMDPLSRSLELNKELFPKGSSTIHELENAAPSSHENRSTLKRSNSTSDLKAQSNLGVMFSTEGTAPIINEYYCADTRKHNVQSTVSSLETVLRREGYIPKLRCRVTGAYFEKHGSKSFAVYSIAVTDADNNTWFVKRRYRNFERLHRHLKDIPNYTLHLPPKRIFSSSTEDSFVHQRCIQLDKYLKDLLSIANVAEQHEVWDFLSSSSQNYSFGKSPSVMRTLAVNVDDAMDDIVRQFKGVSDGLMWKVGGTSAGSSEQSTSVATRHLSWNADDINKLSTRQSMSESINSYSDNDEGDKDVRHGEPELEGETQANGWNSDFESKSKGFQHPVVKLDENISNLDPDEVHTLMLTAESSSFGRYEEPNLALTSSPQQDPTVVPPEWTPPNLSVPVLNLVDNLFQLKRRGWIRRQVFWISKQILQLVMEDAIDDWLLRQIQWLRREDAIAQGIRWVEDVLWPSGTFFLRLRAQEQPNDCETPEGAQQTTKQSGGVKAAQPGSFEQQLEAARRASDVKKIIFNGAPTTLVSLIGQKQYRKCARDIYYFLQSTVCLKQLGYGILELVLISIFPELRDVVMDIHKNDPLKGVPKK